MLCVETFVTQQLVPVTRVSDHHHPEYKSCMHMLVDAYDNIVWRITTDPTPGADIAADVYSIDLYGMSRITPKTHLVANAMY